MPTENPHPDCDTCHEYLDRRAHVLAPAVVFYARKRGMAPIDLLVEFAGGVHRRHLGGLSLGTSL